MMRGDHNRFGRHIMQFGRSTLILPVLFSWCGPALALNWEGHDDWFHDTAPFREFYDGIPAPKTKPMPACSARQAAYDKNRYEQIPLPGVNCRPDAAPDNTKVKG